MTRKATTAHYDIPPGAQKPQDIDSSDVSICTGGFRRNRIQAPVVTSQWENWF